MSQITKFARITLWLGLAGFAGATLVIASAFLYLSPNRRYLLALFWRRKTTDSTTIMA